MRKDNVFCSEADEKVPGVLAPTPSSHWRQLLYMINTDHASKGCSGVDLVFHVEVIHIHTLYTPMKMWRSQQAKMEVSGKMMDCTQAKGRERMWCFGKKEKEFSSRHARPHWKNHLFSLWQGNISFEEWIKGDETQRRTEGARWKSCDFALIPVQSTPGAATDSHSTDQRSSALTGWSQSALTQQGNHWNVTAGSCSPLKQSLGSHSEPSPAMSHWPTTRGCKSF